VNWNKDCNPHTSRLGVRKQLGFRAMIRKIFQAIQIVIHSFVIFEAVSAAANPACTIETEALALKTAVSTTPAQMQAHLKRVVGLMLSRKPGITNDYGDCHILAAEIVKGLDQSLYLKGKTKRINVQGRTPEGSIAKKHHHSFVIVTHPSGAEFIVCSTYRQFIFTQYLPKNLPRVFVGTREQLISLLESHEGLLSFSRGSPPMNASELSARDYVDRMFGFGPWKSLRTTRDVDPDASWW
jgi:hypothetical protein